MTTESKRDLVLGTAGHIDHGKSTLVQALTGTDPDRLSEEKQRGITIELGFAQLELPDGSAMGVVDVPGHERFVRQMIAGSTGIDVALLCIAADDGIMPQTEEHLAVLQLLAVPTCVVALTKCDLVDEEWALFMEDEVRTRLAGTPYATAAIVPVSARTGQGLDMLREAIQLAARGTAGRAEQEAMRLPVDRSFTIKGAGTVVTGTLWSGIAHVGDEVEVLPLGLRTRIRGIQVHGQAVEQASSGHRTALNLNAVTTDDVRPGSFICTPDAVTPTDHFDVDITYLGLPDQDKPLETGCRVLMDGVESVSRGQTAAAQIRTECDLPVAYGDRFVIRSYSPVHVIGGGVVLRAHPKRTTTVTQADRTLLDALRSGDGAKAVQAAFDAAEFPATPADIAHATGLSPAQTADELEALAERGTAEMLPGAAGANMRFATKRMLQKLSGTIENTLLRFHSANPAATGMSKEALRQACMPRCAPDAFDAVLARACAEGKAVADGGMISHPQAGAGARKLEEDNAEKLAELLATVGPKPPTVADLLKQADLAPKQGYKALGLLEKQGRAVKASEEFYFDAAALGALEQAVRAALANGPASAADLKDAMGLSRKHAIPVLEHFDDTGVTRRVGDARELAS